MGKIFAKLVRHKFTVGIAFLLIVGGGYWGYAKIFSGGDAVRYVTAQVQKGTLVVSISGSGQVLASNQADIKPKVSGDVIYVGVKNGQDVNIGTLLAQIDSRNAQKAARDAKTALETANFELEELLEPADSLTLLQAENSFLQIKESKQKAEDNLARAYEDGFNAIVSAFFDLPTIMTEMKNILYDTTISKGQDNIAAYADIGRVYDEGKSTQYKENAEQSYQSARLAYDKNFQNYKATNRYSDKAIIESLVDETYETTKKIADAIKDADNLISFVVDCLTQRRLSVLPVASIHQNSIKTLTGKTNSALSSLLSIKAAIKSNREAILSAERSIAEKELSLAKLKAGPDKLDVRAKKIAIQQKEDALLTVQQTLADHFIRAPFDGVIAKLNVKKGDSASSATVLASLITRQKIAEISLNEVDAAKVKAGQKATLTFDAIEGLSIAGEILEIDTLGTVSQGVVSYTAKITFDTQDDRVKPGMSVSAAIITEVKQNVLLVPNSAVKSLGDTNYVEMLNEEIASDQVGANGAGITSAILPRQQSIQIGSANDEFTEVISGLKEGERVVTRTRTITADTAQTQSQQSTGFRIPGMGGGGR